MTMKTLKKRLAIQFLPLWKRKALGIPEAAVLDLVKNLSRGFKADIRALRAETEGVQTTLQPSWMKPLCTTKEPNRLMRTRAW